jgi:hypothetical protein
MLKDGLTPAGDNPRPAQRMNSWTESATGSGYQAVKMGRNGSTAQRKDRSARKASPAVKNGGLGSSKGRSTGAGELTQRKAAGRQFAGEGLAPGSTLHGGEMLGSVFFAFLVFLAADRSFWVGQKIPHQARQGIDRFADGQRAQHCAQHGEGAPALGVPRPGKPVLEILGHQSRY